MILDIHIIVCINFDFFSNQDGNPIPSFGNNLEGTGPQYMFGRTPNGATWNGVQGFQFNASRSSVMVLVTQDNGNGCGGGNNVLAVRFAFILFISRLLTEFLLARSARRLEALLSTVRTGTLEPHRPQNSLVDRMRRGGRPTCECTPASKFRSVSL